jgi:hypothetical protein
MIHEKNLKLKISLHCPFRLSKKPSLKFNNITNLQFFNIFVEIIYCGAVLFSLTIDNDLVLLRLSRDVIFTDKIVPACLPQDPTKTYAGEHATVSGTNISHTPKPTV